MNNGITKDNELNKRLRRPQDFGAELDNRLRRNTKNGYEPVKERGPCKFSKRMVEATPLKDYS